MRQGIPAPGGGRGLLRRCGRTTLTQDDCSDEIPLRGSVLDFVTEQSAVGPDVDDDIAVREDLILDGFASSKLDVEGIRRLMVFEGWAHSRKFRSLKAVCTVSPSASGWNQTDDSRVGPRYEIASSLRSSQ